MTRVPVRGCSKLAHEDTRRSALHSESSMTNKFGCIIVGIVESTRVAWGLYPGEFVPREPRSVVRSVELPRNSLSFCLRVMCRGEKNVRSVVNTRLKELIDEETKVEKSAKYRSSQRHRDISG